MKLIPALVSCLAAFGLAIGPSFAQRAPSDPTPVLNWVTADNQHAGDRTGPARWPGACAGGSEQALRHQIETLAAGQPDYAAMAPVAAQWRSQIERLGPSVTRQWGALLSLKGTPLHRGLFEARFEHVRLRWEIVCQSSYGKITGISFKTLS